MGNPLSLWLGVLRGYGRNVFNVPELYRSGKQDELRCARNVKAPGAEWRVAEWLIDRTYVYAGKTC